MLFIYADYACLTVLKRESCSYFLYGVNALKTCTPTGQTCRHHREDFWHRAGAGEFWSVQSSEYKEGQEENQAFLAFFLLCQMNL